MSSKFTSLIDAYHVLTLNPADYKPSKRTLPEGLVIEHGPHAAFLRKQEKRLLRQRFDDWPIPYCQRLVGWQPETPIFVLKGDELIAGVYLCNRNEFTDEPNHGQLHYAFIDNRYGGQGIYSCIFRYMVNLCLEMNIDLLYLNSDRYLLPEVYLRWGAIPYKTIEKQHHFVTRSEYIGPFINAIRFIRSQLKSHWYNLTLNCD